jgi:hypothetical protein
MPRFKLIHETDEDKVGDCDGIQAYININPPIDPEDFRPPNCCDKIPSGAIPYDFFTLDDLAFATNVVSMGTNLCRSLLCDAKTKAILETHYIPNSKFFAAPLKHKDQILDYYWFFIAQNLYLEIDYQSTIFDLQESVFEPGQRKLFQNAASIQLEVKRIAGIGRIRPIGPYRLPEKIKSYDIVKIGGFDMDMYFSARLKHAFEEAGISGIYFAETDYFD